MRNKIQAPGKQVPHKQVPKAQALQKEKDPRLVAVGGFGQVCIINSSIAHSVGFVNFLSAKCISPSIFCSVRSSPDHSEN